MRVVLQRVKHASVHVDGQETGSIGQGFLILLGVSDEDDETIADKMADKICRLRIFEDENGKMNRSLGDIGGELLVISNFTLCADCRRGNRPDFLSAELPAEAERLYEYFIAKIKEFSGRPTEKGIFGADMKVDLENDGPVTLVVESGELKASKKGYNGGNG